MKLWKIMLAALIAVLMISTVAMAEADTEAKCPTTGADHAWVLYDDEVVYKSVVGGTHNAYWTARYVCACGEWDTRTNLIEGTPCTSDGSETYVEATCTEGSYRIYKCAVCKTNYTVAGNTPSKGGHDWRDAKYVVTAATCVKDGVKAITCRECDAVKPGTEEAVKDANAHKTTWHDGKKPTCGVNGHNAYMTCDRCGKMWDADGKTVITAPIVIPFTNANHEYDANAQKKQTGIPCGGIGWTEDICINCDYKKIGSYVSDAHVYNTGKEIRDGEGKSGYYKVTKAPTCFKEGSALVYCLGCNNQSTTVVIPAYEHVFTEWEYNNIKHCTLPMTGERECVRGGCDYEEFVIVKEAVGHVWKDTVTLKPTCDKPGKMDRVCLSCNEREFDVVIKATGHDYEEKVTAATCTKDGKIVKTCKVCKDKVSKKIPAAHGATKEVVGTKPACGVKGVMNIVCTVCDAVVGTKDIAALSHEYSWKATAPTPSANGKNEYVCALCGHVAETKVVKYTKMYYNNTMTSFGPMTRELVGGNDWERVTPVDLTVDGVYTYDLIASNKYIVGKVTITVNAGTLTVSYSTKGNVDVKDEALLIYASKADLATGTAVTAPVGAAINAAETFGADTKVLVSLVLTGDYDAAGKGLVDASAAAGMIANID